MFRRSFAASRFNVDSRGVIVNFNYTAGATRRPNFRRKAAPGQYLRRSLVE
jgi:hypothetical protein